MKINRGKATFFSFDDASFLRGFWCIIVVLVHIPADYQNVIQDALGSFAYVGVTFFFMTSAYGLKRSVMFKPDYLECFWGKKLPHLMVPAILANALTVIATSLLSDGQRIGVISFINVNEWLKVLLLFYAVFWLVYYILPKLHHVTIGKWQDYAICMFVLVCCLIDYFTDYKVTGRWFVEPLGFAYGILAANYYDRILRILSGNWFKKSVILLAISIVLGILYLEFKTMPILGEFILKAFLGLIITIFIFEILSGVSVGNKCNSFFATISYEVFLTHGAVFRFIQYFDKGLNLDSSIFIILAIVLTAIVSYCLHKVSHNIIACIVPSQ